MWAGDPRFMGEIWCFFPLQWFTVENLCGPEAARDICFDQLQTRAHPPTPSYSGKPLWWCVCYPAVRLQVAGWPRENTLSSRFRGNVRFGGFIWCVRSHRTSSWGDEAVRSVCRLVLSHVPFRYDVIQFPPLFVSCLLPPLGSDVEIKVTRE